MSDDDDGGGWKEYVDSLDKALSQESEEAEAAEDLRVSSESEEDAEICVGETAWWVKLLQQHAPLPQAQTSRCRDPVRLLSACTGACAEGHVLQAGFVEQIGFPYRPCKRAGAI